MFEYKVVKHIADLSDAGHGYTKELNLVSWNGADPKYDIRTWFRSSEGEKMLRGVTLTEEELNRLVDAVKGE